MDDIHLKLTNAADNFEIIRNYLMATNPDNLDVLINENLNN